MPAGSTDRGPLDTVAAASTTLLSNWLHRLIGPSADHTAFGFLTWADLGVTLCLLLLLFALSGAVYALLRCQMKPSAVAGNHAALHHQVIGSVGKPLYLLIWVYGIYFIATPWLLKLKPNEGLEVVHDLLDAVFDLGIFVVLLWLFFRYTRALEHRLVVWTAGANSIVGDSFAQLLGKSLRIFVPVVGAIFALPILKLPTDYAGVIAKGTSILLIVAVAMVCFQAVEICDKAVRRRFDLAVADNLRARKVYTQVHLISRVVYSIIGLFTVASVLMLFNEVRHVGISLLASAGLVGIIAGVAAQKPLANLMAGFQIALTQPVRQDDVVVVEGEWGRVEEITLTYVVVHIWDDRRLVLPLGYFIERPFQNWTRTSAGLLGSIILWVDYSFPVEAGRKALKLIIESSPLWDKRFWNLQVSDVSEKSVQLRVLATAIDSSQSWDLRCEIREKFIAYIQQHHPQSLPQLRTQVAGAPSDAPLHS